MIEADQSRPGGRSSFGTFAGDEGGEDEARAASRAWS